MLMIPRYGDWRVIHNQSDQMKLQEDIGNLYAWSITNKIKFHPNKCKVVTVGLLTNPLKFLYSLNGTVLEYSTDEKDLGVNVTKNLKWNSHHKSILIKAGQKLGLMRRTCNFNRNKKFRRLLFLSIIRSQFEHASPVWRPTTITQMDKFEALQKRCIKWISNEDFCYYSKSEYFKKQENLDILPMYLKFRMNDIMLFHKMVYNTSVLTFPPYILSASSTDPSVTRYFSRQTRQFNNSDRLKYKSALTPRIDAFKYSFFVRTIEYWNALPLTLREIECKDTFREKLKDHLWVIGREDNGIT